ncbi:MAG: ImmA/IrrE family metallo-endopeptidase [Bellilinea sp.]
MVIVNHEILRWARETAGLSLEEASRKLHINGLKDLTAVDRLKSFETGDVSPTRALLLKMAKQYHRPLIVFYMTQPPRQGNRGQDFRTLPQDNPLQSNAFVDALIRDILARQSIVRAAMEDEDDIQNKDYVNSMQLLDGVPAFVKSINQTLKFNLNEFQKKFSAADAFSYLRNSVESIGIFVLLVGDLGSHHTKLGVETFRGFAIADNIAPFIVINDNDSKAAYSFTLIHELVHIWLGHTGVSNKFFDKKVEQFCNDVASEFLLPIQEIARLDISTVSDLEELSKKITEFADHRNLSSTLVAYRLYRFGKIDKNSWNQLSIVYQNLWMENKTRQRIKMSDQRSAPDYYIVRRYRAGSNLLATVKRMMVGGYVTTSKAGIILGVKAKNVQKLLETNGTSKQSRYSLE